MHQRLVKHLFALLYKRVRYSLPHAWAFQVEIFILQLLSLELKNIPAIVKVHRIGIASDVHRRKELINQLRREIILLEITLRGESLLCHL